MNQVQYVRVKVCCISSKEEAALAVACGASALGLVSSMPSGPGVIAEELIKEIASTVPPGIASFLLTSKQNAPSIIRQQRSLGVNTLQLCDSVEPTVYPELRQALPGISLVQVVHVRGEGSIAESESVSPFVDAILLDSGNQSLPVKKLGGTGEVHDWAISKRIRRAVDVPVYLAGGLNAGNVAQAVAEVGPFALDVCSGVRTNGKLDADKLNAFFAAVHRNALHNSPQ